MELLWTPLLLLVASCVSTVHSLPEMDTSDPSINIPEPLHILEERNLLVLTPAGLTQTLNETRFLMVLFRECPIIGGRERMMSASLLLGPREAFGGQRSFIYY
jgi:hypothetical protein